MLDKTAFTVHRCYYFIDEAVTACVANLNPSAHRHASHLTNTIFTVNENYILKLKGSD
jgi:hypothetical protein